MNQLTLALLRLGQATRIVTHEEAREFGLTPVQAQTLLFVKNTKSFATSVRNLAKHLGATHASTVEVINGLAVRGLLMRQPSALDRRVTLLRLTPQGEETCQKLSHWGHLLEEALATLTPEEYATLAKGLGGVIWGLRAAGHLAIAEPCRGCIYFNENAAPDQPEPHHCQFILRFLSEEEAAKDCPDHRPAREGPPTR